jgi:hypothetical protein
MSALIPLNLTPFTFCNIAWQCSEDNIEAVYQLVHKVPGFDKTLVFQNERLARVCVPDEFDLSRKYDGGYGSQLTGAKNATLDLLQIWSDAGVRLKNAHLWLDHTPVIPEELHGCGDPVFDAFWEWQNVCSSRWAHWPRLKHMIDVEHYQRLEANYQEHLRLKTEMYKLYDELKSKP